MIQQGQMGNSLYDASPQISRIVLYPLIIVSNPLGKLNFNLPYYSSISNFANRAIGEVGSRTKDSVQG